MNKLERYWPTHDEINRCIKSQAETASEAVLLAVHQSCPIAIRNAGSAQETPASEKELLDAFLTPDLPEGMLLLPITGTSGAGKSHMIRWLAAQLKKEDPAAERRHVIRIPKSASLRTVVDLITERLKDDPRYAEARAELKRVTAEVTPEIGAVRFAGGLQIALKNLASQLLAELKENPQIPNANEIRARIHHAQKLPPFFGDAVLRDHFQSNVLARIVNRAISGQDPNVEQEAGLPQFVASDLEIPDHVDIGQAAQPVRLYHQTVLCHGGGKGREAAAAVLNDVVDDAIAEVFQLRQSLGGVTLEDIILRIRDLLFEDGRELVLLIEDFAALSGIQETLLHVSIQEAVRDGRPVRATMRTAMALTDGYLGGRDTILTRAKREWVIRTSLETPKEVIERTSELVGAYLNAARWGEDNLQQKFKDTHRHPRAGLTGWVPPFDDERKSAEEAELLAGFEVTSAGASLFPYNRAAIRSLAERHLTVGGRLVFNPRRIIDFVLREILLPRRKEFEQNLFPPAQFEGANPTAEIASWLSRTVPNSDVKGRLASLIFHWGGNPTTIQEVANLKPGLFKAFGLKTPSELGEVPTEVDDVTSRDLDKRDGEHKARNAGNEDQDVAKRPPRPSPEDARILEWAKKLEGWTTGTRLGNQDANLLRKEIVAALSNAVDWNALRRSSEPIQANLIYLPNALGGDQNPIAIAKDSSDPDGRLRRVLLAFVRFYFNDHKWSYPLADEDSVVIANFIDDLVPHYVSHLEANDSKAIAALRTFLVRQGRVVGIKSRAKTPDCYAETVFAKAAQINEANVSEQSAEGRWLELQKSVVNFREDFKKLLLERVGCFQGTGNTSYAVDILRLAEAPDIENDNSLTDLTDANQRRHVTDLQPARLRARIQPVIKGLITFAKTVRESVDDASDLEALLNALEGLISDLEAAGIWPGAAFDKQSLVSDLAKFRGVSLNETLAHIEPLSNAEPDKDLDSALDCVGSIDLSIVSQIREFIGSTAAFINAVDRTVSGNEGIGVGVNPQQAVAQLQQSLAAIEDNLKTLAPEGTVP
jgi:hypothetical protein